MPRMTLDLSVERLAQTIAELPEEERETLALLLSEHGEQLKRRKEEIEQDLVEGSPNVSPSRRFGVSDEGGIKQLSEPRKR